MLQIDVGAMVSLGMVGKASLALNLSAELRCVP